jgi:hypothetical protein
VRDGRLPDPADGPPDGHAEQDCGSDNERGGVDAL